MRQDAIYDTDTNSEVSETSSFGFVRYFNAESSESFIDHGENIEQDNNEKEIQNTPSKLTLAVVNQISGESGSSFETTTRPYMACEDLVNIDESTEIDLLNTNKYIPKERHSLPSKFVGNKFNKSSMTMVYIPHWSNSDSNLAKSLSKSDSSDEETTTTHSSSIDVPINPIIVPDSIVAEILYNFDDNNTNKSVLKPPTMFRNDSLGSTSSLNETKTENKKSITASLSNLSLQYANINFRKHSINSDKPKRLSRTPDKSETNLNDEEIFVSCLEPTKIENLVYDATKHSLSRKKNIDSDKTNEVEEEVIHKTVLPQLKSNKPAVLPKPTEYKSKKDINLKRRSKSKSSEREIDNDFKPRIIYYHKKPETDQRDILEVATNEEIVLPTIEKSLDTQQLPTQDPIIVQKELELFHKLTGRNNEKDYSRPGSSKEKFSLELPSNKRRSSHDDASPILPRREFDRFRRRSSHEDQLPNLPQNKSKKESSLRKCVSYHYLQIGRRPSCTYSPFCRCCTEPCFSRRSSDSGMAGSCTLNSPDLANTNDENDIRFPARDHYSLVDMPITYQDLDARNVVSYSEMEARDFEAQCRCTSPFGSTPRTSCQASTSDNVTVETHDLSSTSVTSSCSDMSPFPFPQPWESENQIHEKIMSVKSQQNTSSIKSKSCGNFAVEENREQEVFRSGLYAHWWMKAKLPVSVIKGIVEEKNSSTAGKGF